MHGGGLERMNSSRMMFIESDFVKESLISVYSVDPSEMNQLRGGNIILPGQGTRLWGWPVQEAKVVVVEGGKIIIARLIYSPLKLHLSTP